MRFPITKKQYDLLAGPMQQHQRSLEMLQLISASIIAGVPGAPEKFGLKGISAEDGVYMIELQDMTPASESPPAKKGKKR
jgi:hypothetical protein